MKHGVDSVKRIDDSSLRERFCLKSQRRELLHLKVTMSLILSWSFRVGGINKAGTMRLSSLLGWLQARILPGPNQNLFLVGMASP